jgi:hypothetical protein
VINGGSEAVLGAKELELLLPRTDLLGVTVSEGLIGHGGHDWASDQLRTRLVYGSRKVKEGSAGQERHGRRSGWEWEKQVCEMKQGLREY